MNKFILTIISITSLLLINGCGLDQLIDSEQSITRAGNPNPEGEESDTNEETEAEEIPTFDPQDNPQEKPSYTEETPQEKEKIWMNKGWGKCPYLEVEVDTEDKQLHLTTYESPEAEEPCDKTSAPYQTDLDGTLKSSPGDFLLLLKRRGEGIDIHLIPHEKNEPYEEEADNVDEEPDFFDSPPDPKEKDLALPDQVDKEKSEKTQSSQKLYKLGPIFKQIKLPPKK